MIAGRIDYQCPLPATMIPLIQTNKVKGIATLGKGRLAGLPDLPNAQEQGLEDFEAPTWAGFFMPKSTPELIIRKLNQATIATLDTPSVQQRLGAVAPRSLHLTAAHRNTCGVLWRAKSKNGPFRSRQVVR
jgi:tripartite-type tricarboxylate transporter receptor subunit TctC